MAVLDGLVLSLVCISINMCGSQPPHMQQDMAHIESGGFLPGMDPTNTSGKIGVYGRSDHFPPTNGTTTGPIENHSGENLTFFWKPILGSW